MPILKTKLHELRKERNMQQAELAKLVGVRRETIGNLENGKYNPSLKLAMDIAKVFNTTVEDIFSFEKKSQEKADEVYKEKATKNVLA
jgi:putative transcriptional regulator